MTASATLEFDGRPSAARYMLRGAWPVRRTRGLAPQIVARWRGHRADPEDLGAFARATGLPAGRCLSILYPHVVGFRLSMAVLTHPAFPVPIWGVVQTRNHLLCRRPIDAGERLDFETCVVASRVLDKGLEVDLGCTVRAGSEPVWSGLTTFYARGRFGAPGDPSPLARPLGEAGEPGTPVASWAMSDEAHYRFGRLTGDYNGIHFWDWYARRFRFRRALYHPPRVLGQCLARLAEPPPAMQRLDAWLKGPVAHGASVELSARRADDGATDFWLFAGEPRPCMIGRWGTASAADLSTVWKGA